MKTNYSHIDIHAHVNFAAFDADRDETIRRALDAGVAVINVGTQKDTSRAAVALSEKYETGVFAIVGLHPVHTSSSFHDAKELGEPVDSTQGRGGFTSRGEVFDTAFYLELLKRPKVVGVGECGLDYYRLEEESIARQKEGFLRQIEVANESQKPLMLHFRNGSGRSAYNDAYDILKTEARVPGNLHFFAGSVEEAKPFLELGYTFSFTGVVTFASQYEEILRYLPLDRMLSETDCPYVAPAPFRGKRNEPMHVREVVKAISLIKNEKIETVQKQILENAKRVFNLPI